MSKRISYNTWQKDTVYSRYNGKCGFCGKDVSRNNITVSHKKPLSKGGDNSMENLVLSCWECNHIKNDMSMDLFFKKIQQIFEYNQNKN